MFDLREPFRRPRIRGKVALALIALAGTAPMARAHAACVSPAGPACVAREAAFRGSPRVRKVTVGGVKANVLLPVGYATSERRYPVLYLIHGSTTNQDSWLNNTDVERFTASLTDERTA